MERVVRRLPEPFQRLLTGRGETARSGRSALFAFAIRIVSAAIAFLSQVLLARWMGAHEFGIFTYVWVWVTIIGTLATLGFATSVIRFLPDYRERGLLEKFRGFLNFGNRLALASGFTAALAGAAVIWLVGARVETYYVVPLLIVLVCLPAYAMTDFQDGVGRSQGWIDLALLPPYVLRPVLLFAVIGFAIFISGREANAETAVLAAAAATWITAAIQFSLQRRRLAAIVPPGPAVYEGRNWIAQSLPLLMLDGFALLMLNLDIVILKLFVEPSEIGVYFAAVRTISLVSFIHFAVTAVAMPRFAAMDAAGRRHEVWPFLKTMQTWTFIPSALLAGSLVVLGKPILGLFGPDFQAAWPVMAILALGLLARAAAGPAQSLLVATGHQKAAAIILGVTVIINAVFNVILIPRLGLAGAAIASATAFVFESAATILVARRLYGRT